MVANVNPVSGEITREMAKLPKEQRQVLADTLMLVARALLHLPAGRIVSLERQFRDALPAEDTWETAGEETLDTLEMRNKLRQFARWKGIEERALPGSLLQQQLGVTRQRLQQLRAERKLLGLRLPARREMYYPLWQFGADGAPLRAMPRLLRAAEEARLDPLELDALLSSASAGDGMAPARLLALHRDEEVLEIVRTALAHGS